MFRASIIALMLLMSCALSVVSAAEVEFNYNGRVRVHGQDFDGSGLFKFVLTSQDGQHVYWANDGVTLTGAEPTASVQTTVTRGFFTVNIGDTGLAGMAPLNPAIFNTADQRARLLVWFSDGTHGFQRLLPDSEVLNPALLGLRTNSSLNLYVNPTTGNDAWPGDSSARPKRTIQAAWNALPDRIEADAVIQLAPGAYYESPTLSGKTVLPSKKILLVGNGASPRSYIVSGALNAATSETASRSTGIAVDNQLGLELQGLTIRRATTNGLAISNYSNVQVTSCVLERNFFSATITHSQVRMVAVEAAYSGYGGVYYHTYATGSVENCNFHHMQAPNGLGIASWNQSNVRVVNSRFADSTWGITLQTSSLVNFEGANTMLNINKPLHGKYNCTILNYDTAVTYTNVANPPFIETGTQAIP